MQTGDTVTTLVNIPYFSSGNTTGVPDLTIPAGTQGTVVKSSVVVQFTLNGAVEQIEVLDNGSLASVLQDNTTSGE